MLLNILDWIIDEIVLLNTLSWNNTVKGTSHDFIFQISLFSTLPDFLVV